MDFPNLPYLIDGDFKLTESLAVERYIINKSGRADELLGGTPMAMAKTNQLVNVLVGVFVSIADICFNKEYEKIK